MVQEQGLHHPVHASSDSKALLYVYLYPQSNDPNPEFFSHNPSASVHTADIITIVSYVISCHLESKAVYGVSLNAIDFESLYRSEG